MPIARRRSFAVTALLRLSISLAAAGGSIALAASPPGALPTDAAGSSAGAAADAAPPSFQPCRIEHPSRIVAFTAECTTLRVPENPGQADGRSIELSIARIPAISRRKAADPLFLIAGGPGGGTQAMYPLVAAAFTRIGRDRDIVLLDQRGTGRSAALQCELDEEDLTGSDPSMVPALAQRCLDSLQQGGRDVRPYTTSVAVQDLDRVRAALGYAQINLYGTSYGSRVAQHYLRRFPQHTRSVILDGVVPPGLALGPELALDAEAALERILARCAADPACHAAFGDPAQHYRALRASLETAPVDLTLPDPATGTPRALHFTAQHLGAVLRLSSYADLQASLLPMALHEARTNHNFTPLAGLFLVSAGGLRGQLAFGMHNTVVCTEDLPFIDARRIDRTRLAATYLGVGMLDGLQALCTAWPRGPLDADFREPLASDVPVLLLSGADDPVTPPASAVAALQGLTRARHLVIPGKGHGQIGVTCMDRIVAEFIRDTDPARLDAGCLARSRPAPFFTSPAGPPP